jgi:hypothetical protein
MSRLIRIAIAVALVLAAAGCYGTAYDHGDHGHDALVELDAADAEVHEAPKPFVRLGLTYRAPAGTPIEVSTSADGATWSEWATAVRSEDADDLETDVRIADHDVASGEPASFVRVRGVPGAAEPQGVVLAVLDGGDLEDAIGNADDEIAPTMRESDDPDVAGAVAAAGSFRVFRFDQGRVTRAWLWLLRKARRRGWRGSLYGPRTGLRTYRQQQQLWNAYQNGTGAPAFAPWGPSRHMIRNVRRRGKWYQAVDTNDVGRLIHIARRLGVRLHTPYAGEPWHVEARRRFNAPRTFRP